MCTYKVNRSYITFILFIYVKRKGLSVHGLVVKKRRKLVIRIQGDLKDYMILNENGRNLKVGHSIYILLDYDIVRQN